MPVGGKTEFTTGKPTSDVILVEWHIESETKWELFKEFSTVTLEAD